MLLFQASKSSPWNRKIKISLPLIVSLFGSMFTKKMRKCVTETPPSRIETSTSCNILQSCDLFTFPRITLKHATFTSTSGISALILGSILYFKVCYPFTMANLRSLPCNENLTSSSSESEDGFVPNEDCDLSPPASKKRKRH